MFTSRTVSILALALCAMAAGATTPALAAHAAAASAAPKVAVVGHVSTYLATARNPRRDQMVRQLTLRITGSHFVPGSRVAIALVNTRTWEIMARGSTYAGFAVRQCSWTIRDCSEPNPRAGTIDYRVLLSPAPAAPNLLVLYRSAGDAGMQGVTLR